MNKKQRQIALLQKKMDAAELAWCNAGSALGVARDGELDAVEVMDKARKEFDAARKALSDVKNRPTSQSVISELRNIKTLADLGRWSLRDLPTSVMMGSPRAQAEYRKASIRCVEALLVCVKGGK